MRFNKSKQNIEVSLAPSAGYGLVIPEGTRSLRLGLLTIVIERMGFPDRPAPDIEVGRRAEAEARIARENAHVPAHYQPTRQLTR